MLVFVEDAAESVVSPDVKVIKENAKPSYKGGVGFVLVL
jgi:hypothetical protein